MYAQYDESDGYEYAKTSTLYCGKFIYKFALFFKICTLFFINILLVVVIGCFTNAVVTDCEAMQKRLIETYSLVLSENRGSLKPIMRIPCLRWKIGNRKFPHKLIRPVALEQGRSQEVGGKSSFIDAQGVNLVPPLVVCLQRLSKEDESFLLEVYGKLSNCGANLVYLSDKASVEDNIVAMKQMEKSERHELLRNASLLVCPRRHSGFHLALLEAMALGCPVLASNTGSALEFVENGRTGFLLTNKV